MAWEWFNGWLLHKKIVTLGVHNVLSLYNISMPHRSLLSCDTGRNCVSNMSLGRKRWFHTTRRSLVHSFTRHSLTHPSTHPLTHSPTHPLTHSLTHSRTHALLLTLTHSLTHSHSLTHWLTHTERLPIYVTEKVSLIDLYRTSKLYIWHIQCLNYNYKMCLQICHTNSYPEN